MRVTRRRSSRHWRRQASSHLARSRSRASVSANSARRSRPRHRCRALISPRWWFDGLARTGHCKAMSAKSTRWRRTVLTLFPEMFPGPLGVSLAGRALASGLWALEIRDIRDSATDRHRSVDDTPAGGGPGMVLRADVLAAAIDAAVPSEDRPRLVMSPRGRPLTQSRIVEFAAGPGPLIVCGRLEGIAQRGIEARGLEEVSIGDYVLSGGEIAALAMVDACVRLLPGVMGKLVSGAEESFSDGLLEYPQYTRPQQFEGQPIPEILTSGDHARVAAWRQAEAEALTRARRPDLWAARAKVRQKRPKNTTDG